jgi:hypothetical protein
MTNTTIVQAEIERFLKSPDPEVLCITGEWGVGKTYNWQANLDLLRSSREIGLSRYSYVSLFGINSIEELKAAIFENMEFLVPEGQAGFDRARSFANKGFQQSKKITGAIAAIPGVGNALSQIAKPLFMESIRNQIVCVDDLERRGEKLSVKDVFGLLSYLKEQRSCKVALLLNEGKLASLPKGQEEFNDHFEKVVDTKVIFSPSAKEAAEIAFKNRDELSQLIFQRAIELNVKNIRVLKKIERLVRIVASAVKVPTPEILQQIVHSLAIFGWSKFDSGAEPPPLSYLSESSVVRYMQRQKGNPASKKEERWDAIIEAYNFVRLDALDRALFDYVEAGVLNPALMQSEIDKKEIENEIGRQANSFEAAFRKLNDSFLDNEEDVCSSIVNGIKDNFQIVSLVNVDEAVEVLERIGRQASASGLIDYAIQHGSDEFWSARDPFGREIKSHKLKECALQRREQMAAPFIFEEDVFKAADNIDHKLIAKVAAAPIERYVSLFKSNTGENLRRATSACFGYRRIQNASLDMNAIVEKASAALQMIAKESSLNAVRVERMGVRAPATVNVSGQEEDGVVA